MAKEYRVRWEIDVEAETPQEAARIAQDLQRHGTTVGVFDVMEHKAGVSTVRVDLDEHTIEPRAI